MIGVGEGYGFVMVLGWLVCIVCILKMVLFSIMFFVLIRVS